MEPIRPTQRLVKRLLPAVAIWGVGKVLESRPVRTRLNSIDQRLLEKRQAALRSVKRGAKRATSRANAAWLAAGAAAFIAGIGMMAKAAKR